MKHTWLKLLTSLLWSQKFRSLPDNDHRIVYICHLIFAKMGLENEPISWLAATCFVTKYRYKIIVTNLVASGLFTDDGKVNGFEDSQLTPDAIRMRRYRERNEQRNSYGNSDANGDGDSRKQKADSSPTEKKEPPTPLRPKTARQASLVPAIAEAVIGIVNEKFGTKRSATPTLVRACRLLKNDGHSDSDICLVVAHRLAAEDWFHPSKYGAESLIRRDKFPSMLQIAKDAPGASEQFAVESEPWK